MKSNLDKYLRILKMGAKRYSIDPLFVSTEEGESFSGEDIGISYKSPIRGNKGKRKILTFRFDLKTKVEKKDSYVPPQKTVRLLDSGVYIVELGPPSSDWPQVSLDIEGEKTEEFCVEYSNRDGAMEWCGKNFKDLDKSEPEKLLKMMVAMYALGIKEFIESQG